jgi:hypothetical protein
MIKYRTIRRMGHVERMGRGEILTQFWFVKPEAKGLPGRH